MVVYNKFDIGDTVFVYYSKFFTEGILQKAKVTGITVRKDKKKNITIKYRVAPQEGGSITLFEEEIYSIHDIADYAIRNKYFIEELKEAGLWKPDTEVIPIKD